MAAGAAKLDARHYSLLVRALAAGAAKLAAHKAAAAAGAQGEETEDDTEEAEQAVQAARLQVQVLTLLAFLVQNYKY